MASSEKKDALMATPILPAGPGRRNHRARANGWDAARTSPAPGDDPLRRA
jgi:hypothetical protein